MKMLYQPVSPWFVSQYFGQNNACVPVSGPKKVISCDGHHPPAGYTSLYGTAGHKGIDIPAKHGQEVYAAHGGVVYKVDTDPKSGLDVRIESTYRGLRFRCIYEHLLGYQPKVGDTIKTGQLIGWADNTGYSSGDHLHFQFEVYKDGAWVATDPLPYMEPICAKNILAVEHKLLYIKEQVAQLADRIADYLRSNKK